MIPKLIHLIWIAEIPLPEKYQKYVDTWLKVNPTYEIRKTTLETIQRNKFVDKAIEIKNYALAGHYARCQELYDHGGIYMDVDVECNNPFDPLLENHSMILGMEDQNIVNNAVFLAEKNHPFLKECMDYMDAFPFDSEKIELATGPIMFTNLMKRRGWTRGRAGTFRGVTVLTPPHFYPYRYDEYFTKECITEKTFCIHHWANSWNDKVSIIIPCYKQAQFLPDAIESALAQTYKSVEVIVVNDGSPDNTSAVARKYPVKLIEQANKGLSGARNAGIRKSSGGWIITLDADDKIAPNYIERLIKKADITSCTLQTFGAENRVWKAPKPEPTHRDLLIRNHIHCCSLFKKDVWTLTGGYDENMKDGFEDWDFWTRASALGFSIVSIDEPLFYYRKHAGGSMVSHAVKNQAKIIAYMKAKYAGKPVEVVTGYNQLPTAESAIKIRYIQPFANDKNFGREYNQVISELPDDCYVVLRDMDTLPLDTDNWGPKIESIIKANPGYSLIGLLTNRLRQPDQLYNKHFSENTDIKEHMWRAEEVWKEHGTTVTPIREIAGCCMIFHKSLWHKVKFKENTLTFDQDFCSSVRKLNLKIGLAKGLYMFHTYRMTKPNARTYTAHLIRK